MLRLANLSSKSYLHNNTNTNVFSGTTEVVHLKSSNKNSTSLLE